MSDTFERGVDIVLDYLWGTSAQDILTAAASARRGDHPMRFIQIGTTSAPTITAFGFTSFRNYRIRTLLYAVSRTGTCWPRSRPAETRRAS